MQRRQWEEARRVVWEKELAPWPGFRPPPSSGLTVLHSPPGPAWEARSYLMSGPQTLGPPAGAPLPSWPGLGKPQGRGSGPQTWVSSLPPPSLIPNPPWPPPGPGPCCKCHMLCCSHTRALCASRLIAGLAQDLLEPGSSWGGEGQRHEGPGRAGHCLGPSGL